MWLEIQEKVRSVFKPAEPACRFKVGELVTADDIEYPMVVNEVVESLRKSDPLVSCKWFDRSTQETKRRLFHASKLKTFDWNVAVMAERK